MKTHILTYPCMHSVVKNLSDLKYLTKIRHLRTQKIFTALQQSKIIQEYEPNTSLKLLERKRKTK